MKISPELTPEKVLSTAGWGMIWLILLTSAWFVFGITDQSEREMVIGGILLVTEKHFYLAIVSLLLFGFGVGNNVKAGRSVASSVFRWLPVSTAFYLAAMWAIILSYM